MLFYHLMVVAGTDNFNVQNFNDYFLFCLCFCPDNTGDSHDHDTDESKGDYDDDSELGPTLDFGAKLDGTDAGNELPIFLVEPQSTYVVRNRAAILKCKAAHALKVRYRRRHKHASNVLLS